ncbi:hypothetical protein ABBQ38_014409 [Trebouxia sp. C0009 RCD-2024]
MCTLKGKQLAQLLGVEGIRQKLSELLQQYLGSSQVGVSVAQAWLAMRRPLVPCGPHSVTNSWWWGAVGQPRGSAGAAAVLHRLDAANYDTKKRVVNLVRKLGTVCYPQVSDQVDNTLLGILEETVQFKEHGQVELLLEVMALAAVQGTTVAAEA